MIAPLIHYEDLMAEKESLSAAIADLKNARAEQRRKTREELQVKT